jgi:small-conductance mechanosensitive channel
MHDVTWSQFLIALGSALGVALATTVVFHLVVRLLGHTWRPARHLSACAAVPFRLFVVLASLTVVVGASHPADVPSSWWQSLYLTLRVLTIGAAGWLVAETLLFLEDIPLRRYRTDVRDNRAARRMRTQVLILRRLTVAAVVVLTLGAVLLSFPGVRTVGASLLASAGVISVIAAVAAQSTLGNLFAGVQVAFSDAIRLDDVVIVEEEWGRIEEITLSYVVVRLWDDRRMVLPCTYFTTHPFQNWTRTTSALLGAVEIDCDWGVDVDGLREELDRVLHTTDLWDGRTQVLQVTDAVGGMVRVRALVTAQDAEKLYDLRCLVRETLVTWINEHGHGLPRQRLEVVEPLDVAPVVREFRTR